MEDLQHPGLDPHQNPALGSGSEKIFCDLICKIHFDLGLGKDAGFGYMLS